MAPRLKAGETVKGVAKGIIGVDDAGVTVTLPSGHQETITTDEAVELRLKLEDVVG